MGASVQRCWALARLIGVKGLLITLILVSCGTNSRPEPARQTAPTPSPEVPAEPAPEPSWVDVAVGRHFSCGVRDDRRVLCWGSNSEGRAGLGEVAHSPVPVLVEGIDDGLAASFLERGEDLLTLLRGGPVLDLDLQDLDLASCGRVVRGGVEALRLGESRQTGQDDRRARERRGHSNSIHGNLLDPA